MNTKAKCNYLGKPPESGSNSMYEVYQHIQLSTEILTKLKQRFSSQYDCPTYHFFRVCLLLSVFEKEVL